MSPSSTNSGVNSYVNSHLKLFSASNPSVTARGNQRFSSWKENVAEWFNGLREDSVLLKVDFNDLVVEENSYLAFAYCAITFAAYQEESGEKLRQMTNRFTYSLKKVNEYWVIAHEHSSLPINMETGKGIFNLK
ncbi:hypothetical protein CHI06_17210 [Bacillus sp. 7884-1]|nr:hypothetical protein CHI06_17210 [Bacillus sp. 7884-1]